MKSSLGLAISLTALAVCLLGFGSTNTHGAVQVLVTITGVLAAVVGCLLIGVEIRKAR